MRLLFRTVSLAAVAVVVAGCGTAASDDAAAPREDPAPVTTTTTTTSLPAKALTVAQMAAEEGCTPRSTVKAADFRQATCAAPGGKLVLLDFDTAEGQRAWLDAAEMYGGVYLVGDRWVLSAETMAYMEALQSKWGGAIVGRK